MAFPLDPEQLKAVETDHLSVVLTAGAGCGKTGTITARFLHLLGKREPAGTLAPPEKRVSLGRIGVMTFTNKAASELRHRIRQACEAESKKAISDADDDAAEYWRLVAFAMEGATISTYHSFYEQLCRSHAESLGLDPDVRLLDQRIAEGLKRESAQEAVRQRLAGGDPVLVEYAARHRLDAVVEQVIHLIGLGEHQTRASLIAEMEPATLADLWQKVWEDEIRPTADQVRDLILLIIGLDQSKFTDTWRKNIAAARNEMQSLHDDYFKAIVRAAEKLKGQKLNRPGLKEALDELYELKNTESFKLMQANLDLLDQAAAETIMMARLTQSALSAYSELKSKRRAVDFDDLVEKAETLAGMGIPLGGKQTRRFDHFLVDEFQDTDRLQARILKSLAGNPFETGQLFVVGDVKQAIYRFRGANPEELLSLRAEMPVEGRQSLVRNYRSCKQVVDFVNILADSMYSAYPESASAGGVKLVAGLTSPQARERSKPAIEFLLTAPKEKEDKAGATASEEAPEESFENHRREAANVAERLRTHLRNGLMVGSRSGKSRKAEPKDVVFITRSRSYWWVYEQALRKEGFDVHQDSIGAFFERQEIRDLINFLCLVENPMDEIRLAAVLRGPLFGVSDETLFWLSRQTNRNGFAAKFHEAEADELRFVPDSELRILRRVKGLLADFSVRKAVKKPSELVQQAMVELEIETILSQTSDEPEQALANLGQLVDDARSFDHDVDFGWPAMIRQWSSDLESGAKADEAVVETPSGRIRFLTIHSSKGLEFPVVVMPGLNSVGRNHSGPYMINPTLGLVTKSRSADTDEDSNDDHPAWKVTKVEVKKEEEKETDNLFYVAATRAMDHLMLSAVFDPRATTKKGEPVKPQGPFLKRLAAAFDLETGQPISGGLATDDLPIIEVSAFPAESAVGSRKV